jgi:hypothetical protein
VKVESPDKAEAKAARQEGVAVASTLLASRCLTAWAEFVRARAAEWQIETLHQALVQAHASQKASHRGSLAGQVLSTQSPLSSKVLGRAEAANHFLLTGVVTAWHHFVAKSGAFSPSPKLGLRDAQKAEEEEQQKKEDAALELTKEELRKEQQRLAALYNSGIAKNANQVIRMVHHPGRTVAHSPSRSRQQFAPFGAPDGALMLGNISTPATATASMSSMAPPGVHIRQRPVEPTPIGLTVPQMAPRALGSNAGPEKRLGLPPPPVLGSGQRLGASASTGQLVPTDLNMPMTPGTPLRWRPQDTAVSPQVQQRMPGLDPQPMMNQPGLVMAGMPSVMTAASPSPVTSRGLMSPEGLTLPGAQSPPQRTQSAVVRLPSNSPALKQNKDADKAS